MSRWRWLCPLCELRFAVASEAEQVKHQDSEFCKLSTLVNWLESAGFVRLARQSAEAVALRSVGIPLEEDDLGGVFVDRFVAQFTAEYLAILSPSQRRLRSVQRAGTFVQLLWQLRNDEHTRGVFEIGGVNAVLRLQEGGEQ